MDFLKILEYKISLKFVQWEPNICMRTDTQKGLTKLIVAVRNFAKVPNKEAWAK
jgi:hypothetical protein